MIDRTPLQLYYAALVFCPPENQIGHHYRPSRGADVRRHTNLAADLVEPKLDFNYVCDLAFTPDGSTLAAGSNLPIVRLWSTETGSKKLIFDKPFQNKVSSVAISPDGVLLAAGADDWRVAVWNLHSGELAYTLSGHKGWVNSVAFSADGRILATGAMDDSVVLSSAADGRHMYNIDNMGGVNSVHFSPDSAKLAAASTDQTIKIWPITEQLRGGFQLLEGHTGSVNCVQFSPQGRIIASGSHDMTVKLWDPSTGEARTLEGHTNKIWAVAFSPNALCIISGSEDRTVRIWDVKSGEALRLIMDHLTGLNSVAISPDGRYLASSSFDDEVRLYDAETWEPRGILEDLESQSATETMERTFFKYSVIARGLPKGHSEAVTCVATSPNQKIVASGSEDARVKMWLLDGREFSLLEGHSGPITTLTFSSDSSRLVSSSMDGTLKIWDVITGSLVRTLNGDCKAILSTLFSPDGRLFVSCALDYSIRLWDTTAWTSVTVPNGNSSTPIAIAFCSKSRFLACGSSDGTIYLWDISLLEASMILRGHTGPITSVAFSPDNKTIVSTSEDRTVRIWKDWHTPRPVYDVVTSDKGTVGSASYSPDGQLLAFCTAGNIVSIWDPKSRTVTESAEVDGGIQRVAFSTCGQRVETNRGTLSIHHAPQSPHARAITFAQFVTNDWLLKDSEQVLWLPENYKATCVAVAQGKVIMGHASGAVSFVDVSDATQDNGPVLSGHAHSGPSIVEGPPLEARPSDGTGLVVVSEASQSQFDSNTVLGQHNDNRRMVAVCPTVTVVTCIFWAFWMSRLSSDWQHAFFPLLTVLAMIMAAWVLASARLRGQ